jgi:hypothetical protein
MERKPICIACEVYGIVPVSLAVDQPCQCKDEVDRLCVLHRGRATVMPSSA